MQLLDIIGEGMFGEIKKCVCQDGNLQAIKIYKTNCPQKLREREIKILTSLNHPNIMKIIQYDVEYRWFTTQLMNNDLYTLIQKHGSLQLRTIKQILLQICHALAYLHDIDYVHRDIKLENIMIDQQHKVQLIDFGLSTCINNQKQYIRHCGTSTYMAPELNLNEKQIDGETLKKCDVFALGVLIFILCYGNPPFQIAVSSQCKFWNTISLSKWQSFWNYFDKNINKSDPKFRNLIQGMLNPQIKERLTIKQILNHEWLIDEGDLQEII